MGKKWRFAGMEVPVVSSDSATWIEVNVSSSNVNSATEKVPLIVPPEEKVSPYVPPFDGCCSCFVGDPSFLLIWRIRKSLPCALELFHLSSSQPFPIVGLRINFPCRLSRFAFITHSLSSSSTHNVYWLYVLSISGIAFLLNFSSNFSVYQTSPVFPDQDVSEFHLFKYASTRITSVAAAAGCLVVGRYDGSVSLFQLGTLHPTASGFANELRDEEPTTGIGRLWGLMSWARLVQDMVIKEVHGKKFVYVLHSGGILRVWDLSCYSMVFAHSMTKPSLEGGAESRRLFVGEANCHSRIIPLAIVYRKTQGAYFEVIHVYSLRCSSENKTILSLESSVQNIQLGKVGCIDVKLTSDKIWVLQLTGLYFRNLFHLDGPMEEAGRYILQEYFVADLLFRNSKHSFDDFLSIIHSIVTSSKDQIVPFVSSIFLRRLLHPGVRHNDVLHATLLDYNRHWTKSKFKSLTVDRLKKEIISLIEHEGVTESPLSISFGWKKFCSRYCRNWFKINWPHGVFFHPSTGAICLLRKNSVSLFRDPEKLELLINGYSDELGDDFFNNDSEREILSEVLRCIISFSQQLRKTAPAIFYESVVGTPFISTEEVVPRLLKILETGYSLSAAGLTASDLGADVAREKELVDHRNVKNFYNDTLLSLLVVCQKAASWDKVLSVIQSYLQFLVPHKSIHNLDTDDTELVFNVKSSILVQATSQIARVMFESALDVLLFVSYLVNINGQIGMSHNDVLKIQMELIPMIQEIVSEWLIILFLGITPSESLAIEDFSSQLLSLQIDTNVGRKSWNEMLGKYDFTLAFILLLSDKNSWGDYSHICSNRFPNPQEVTCSVRAFTSWIIWGKTGEEFSSFTKHSAQLALILHKHSQYNAVEANSQEKIFQSIQDTSGDRSVVKHLLGCCLLTQADCGLPGTLKEKKVFEVVRCFFRASSGQGSCQALLCLFHEAGLPHLGSSGYLSSATWKLHYYQWPIQIFEQYNISEASCQFALAAIEQVDEALSSKDDCYGRNPLNETATTIKGQLWANIFKFTLDCNLLRDAYCAIISNPDEESKYICLRRLIVVLYECNPKKFLCDGQLPFIDLAEKIEQELVRMAERSDILAKPNPFKLLYAIEMQQLNWRRAASYMYLYTTRLRTETFAKDRQQILLSLQERLNGLSAAINALHLVHPAYAWIVKEQSAGNDIHPQSYIDIQKLENEFVLTSAEYSLSKSNVKWTYNGVDKAPSDLVDLLVQTDLYDMTFTVLLKFFKGLGLKSELERIFSAMSLKCCANKVGCTYYGNDFRRHGLLLRSSKDAVVRGFPNIPSTKECKANGQWETLKLYLEKYKGFHAGLPVVVAETLLQMDPQIKLPRWLVHMFKDAQRDRTRGMTGQESSPASLLQLYVDYGRYREATNLLLDYIESYASRRQADIVKRKRPLAVLFPYTTIERLWCQLEELMMLGQMVELQKVVNSNDAKSSASS